jgi:hypothetical protein
METPRKHWFQRHPALALLCIAFAGVVSVFLLGEIFARWLMPGWAPARAERTAFWEYDPLLGWSQRAGARGTFSHLDFAVEVQINSDKLRDQEHPVPRGPQRRLMVLGDSFAWGFGVEAHERFSDLMAARRTDWEFINAAVSGYATDQQVLYFEERGSKYRPDVVLLLLYLNDFEENLCPARYNYFKPYFVLENGALAPQNNPVPSATVAQWLWRNVLQTTYLGTGASYPVISLYRWLGQGRGFEERANAAIEAGQNMSRRGILERSGLTTALLSRLDASARGSGAKLVLVSAPMGPEYVEVLRAWAAQQRVPYLPLDFGGARGQVTFEHDLHWNTTGHRLAAETIERFLGTLQVF